MGAEVGTAGERYSWEIEAGSAHARAIRAGLAERAPSGYSIQLKGAE